MGVWLNSRLCGLGRDRDYELPENETKPMVIWEGLVRYAVPQNETKPMVIWEVLYTGSRPSLRPAGKRNEANGNLGGLARWVTTQPTTCRKTKRSHWRFGYFAVRPSSRTRPELRQHGMDPAKVMSRERRRIDGHGKARFAMQTSRIHLSSRARSTAGSTASGTTAPLASSSSENIKDAWWHDMVESASRPRRKRYRWSASIARSS